MTAPYTRRSPRTTIVSISDTFSGSSSADSAGETVKVASRPPDRA